MFVDARAARDSARRVNKVIVRDGNGCRLRDPSVQRRLAVHPITAQHLDAQGIPQAVRFLAYNQARVSSGFRSRLRSKSDLSDRSRATNVRRLHALEPGTSAEHRLWMSDELQAEAPITETTSLRSSQTRKTGSASGHLAPPPCRQPADR